MKKNIGVIGDTHFGSGPNLGRVDSATQLHTRLLDYQNTFNNNIDYFEKQGIDLVILTGDIFETRHPTSSQHKIFSSCIKRGIDKGMEFIIVVGNHDQQRDISTNTIDLYKTLGLDKVHVFDEFGTFKYQDNTIFLMPFRDRKNFGVSTNQEALDIIKSKLDELGFSNPKIKNKIVIGHYMFEGSIFTGTEYDASINEIYLLKDMFSECSATVMGHIHKGEVLQKSPKIIYSGSMERNTYGERDYDKGVVVINTEDFSKSKFVKVKTRSLFDIKIDYSEKQIEKGEVLKQILSDIDSFAEENDLNGSISRVAVKIDEADLYSINEGVLKNYLYSKGISYCSGISISSFLKHTKKSEISELTDSKKIIASYVNSLKDIDSVKKDMIEFAEKIINDVDGGQGDSSKISIK